MEHAALVAEIPFVERLPLHDRLRHAKKRRAQQLKAYTQREKRLLKEANVSGKRSGKRGSDISAVTTVSDDSEKNERQKRLQFASGVLMMEAVLRNDVSEGTWWQTISRLHFNFVKIVGTSILSHLFATGSSKGLG